MKLPFFKKADIILAVLIVAIGAASLLAFGRAEDLGRTAVISVDGKEIEYISLSQTDTVVIETEYGINTLLIENGRVSVQDADCHGKDCVHFAPISRPGQMIVCLPHHLTITISGDAGDAPDVVVR